MRRPGPRFCHWDWWLAATALTGCNSVVSSLDRGHVSVNGLIPPSALVAATPSPDYQHLGQIQTRQTVTITLPADIVNTGETLSLEIQTPSATSALLTRVPLPPPKQAGISNNLTLSRLSDGSLDVSFYAGLLVRVGALGYGTNAFAFTINHDGQPVNILDVSVLLYDFDVSSVALSGFTTQAEESTANDFQGWVSMLASGAVSEAVPNSGSTVLHTDFFHIVNP